MIFFLIFFISKAIFVRNHIFFRTFVAVLEKY